MAVLGLFSDYPVSARLCRRGGPGGVILGSGGPTGWRGRGGQSEFDLLGDAESIIDLDPEIANGALQLRMPQQELDRSEIASFSIDLGCLRPAHRVGAVGGAVKPGALDPGMYDAGVLACRKVRLPSTAAREEVMPALQISF